MEDKQIIPRNKVKVPKLKLEGMFKQQVKFQARFYDFDKMSHEEVEKYLQVMLQAVSVEAVEALNWLNWKPWKKTKIKFNRYKFINELVDIQHFIINCALAAGCDSHEFARLFFNKGKENINRQKRGY